MSQQIIQKYAEFLKADEELGLVFGWAVVCTEADAPYFDLTKTYDAEGNELTGGDHIPDDAMLDMATDFMLHARVAKEMHAGAEKGAVVHSFPLTKGVAEAFGILCERTGWMIAVKFEDAEILSKFKDGTYKGFSIGGVLNNYDEVEG